MHDPVEIRPNADGGDDIHIRIEYPKCRKCGDRLYGGEIDEGVCDACNN